MNRYLAVVFNNNCEQMYKRAVNSIDICTVREVCEGAEIYNAEIERDRGASNEIVYNVYAGGESYFVEFKAI
jgi:hypothetical protein